MKKTVFIFFFLLLPSLFLSCSNGPEITAIFKGDASIKMTADSIDITEGGSEGSFSVSLTSRPENDVSISFELTDTSEAIITPQNITFAPDDYSTGQAVLVTGLSDCVTDGDQVLKIIIADVTSSDSRYQLSANSLLYEEIDLTVRDDITGKPELLLLSNNPTLQTTESGGDDKFLVALSCPPSAPVTVNLSSSNTSEGILDIQSVTLDSSNYSLGRLITVTGQSDCTNEADISYSITAETGDEADNNFDFLITSKPAVNQNVILSPSIMVIQSSGQVNRGAGTYNNFQAKLSCEPPADEIMNVTVNGLPNGFILYSPLGGTHTFTTTNWNAPVDVILQVTSDLDGAYQIDLSSTTYGSTSVYFGDSGTKRLTINVIGLAGKTTLKNGSDSISFQVPGTFFWHLTTGLPYTFELSEQPSGQVCAIAEKQFGTTTTPFTININCVNGYANGNSIMLNDPATIPPLTVDLFTVTTIAGALPPAPTSGIAVAGPVAGNIARFNMPSRITSDGSNLYISDFANHTIRKVELNSPYNVTTITGNGTAGYLDANGLTAQFNQPGSIATNGTTLFVAEQAGNRIRKIDITPGKNYPVTTLTTTNTITYPADMAISENKLYITSRGHLGECLSAGFVLEIDFLSGEEKILVNSLNEPMGLATDGSYLYVAESCTNKIIKYDTTGAFIEEYGSGIAGYADGDINTAKFDYPSSLLYYKDSLFVTEWLNTGIRKINLNTLKVSTLLNPNSGYADGDYATSRLHINSGNIITDGKSLYFSDFKNHAIRKISSGLAAHYPLAGDTKDYSGNGNDAVLPGGTADPVLIDGPHGNSNGAYFFDGNDDHVYPPIPTTKTTDVAITAWVKWNGPNDYYQILAYNGHSGLDGYGLVMLSPSYELKGLCGGGYGSAFTGQQLPIGKWTHLAMVNNTGSWKVYIDGVNATSSDSCAGNAATPGSNSQNFLIGHGTQSFNGAISDVRVYNRALSAREVGRLAIQVPDGIAAYFPLNGSDEYGAGVLGNEKKLKDYSIYANDGFLGGDGVTASAFPVGSSLDRYGNSNSSYYFDGADKILSNDNHLPEKTDSRTVCAWSRNTLRTNGISQNIIEYGTPLENNSIHMGIRPDDISSAQFYFAGYAADLHMPTTKGTGITNLYSWTHLCGIFDNTANPKQKLYFNGQLVQTGNYNWDTILTGGLSIGYDRNSGGIAYYNGEIDDVRIYNRVLNDAEIKALSKSTGMFFSTTSPSTGLETLMTSPRTGHIAILLNDGRVLIAGGHDGTNKLSSAEIFDPADETFTSVSSMTSIRHAARAALLTDGRVLITGGHNGVTPLTSAEIYNPVTGTFSSTGSMSSIRTFHTSTLMPDGKILITGGCNANLDAGGGCLGAILNTAEIYDPAAGTFSPTTGNMNNTRYWHRATLLPNGKVLITGGVGRLTAEIYDPATGLFAPTGSMTGIGYAHNATLLQNGKVLVTGGHTGAVPLTTAQIYDPTAGLFTNTGSMVLARAGHTAALLNDGNVLITGGNNTATGEIYISSKGIFVSTTSMKDIGRTDTMLSNGEVLFTGGTGINTAEIFRTDY